ncbi:Cys-tRNA(Pro) deacylase [Niallia endozanthoxylica]|uniref:Cys-tRNA(Pro)/Cys-tRNA(Cys) deacylase n=1 Tax=Niallia endozanthoxylica TaxID=2036016 RepID=A0A5J5H208_9BACI|nr:Cys-tRNA(Pro) deacylase [Niallia endozanthoxylica]KAA9014490.1 Cys-tRNA(Pro) deacylase [Niallia endozanthoxylica]
MAQIKTNAMRILDAKKIDYGMKIYDASDGKIDGVSVAQKVNRDPKEVYKTLVTQGTKSIYVFVIPVEAELDLKKAAKAANEKKIDMIAVKDIQKLTGYIRGGCSPVGMKKQYPTFIEMCAEALEEMVVSGGKIGVQIEIKPQDLILVTNGTFAEVIKEHEG